MSELSDAMRELAGQIRELIEEHRSHRDVFVVQRCAHRPDCYNLAEMGGHFCWSHRGEEIPS